MDNFSNLQNVWVFYEKQQITFCSLIDFAVFQKFSFQAQMYSKLVPNLKPALTLSATFCYPFGKVMCSAPQWPNLQNLRNFQSICFCKNFNNFLFSWTESKHWVGDDEADWAVFGRSDWSCSFQHTLSSFLPVCLVALLLVVVAVGLLTSCFPSFVDQFVGSCRYVQNATSSRKWCSDQVSAVSEFICALISSLISEWN